MQKSSDTAASKKDSHFPPTDTKIEEILRKKVPMFWSTSKTNKIGAGDEGRKDFIKMCKAAADSLQLDARFFTEEAEWKARSMVIVKDEMVGRPSEVY
jgi:hypothetical protein